MIVTTKLKGDGDEGGWGERGESCVSNVGTIMEFCVSVQVPKKEEITKKKELKAEHEKQIAEQKLREMT